MLRKFVVASAISLLLATPAFAGYINVAEDATVTLNGKEVGTTWMAPYRLNISDAVKEGENIELDDLRESAGLGIRWQSPMGPIRLEYGWILDRKSTDHGPGAWEFSMATSY